MVADGPGTVNRQAVNTNDHAAGPGALGRLMQEDESYGIRNGDVVYTIVITIGVVNGR